MSHMPGTFRDVARTVFKRAKYECSEEGCHVFRRAGELFLLYDYAQAFGSLVADRFVCWDCYCKNSGEDRISRTTTLKDVGSQMPIVFAIGLLGEGLEEEKNK